MSYDESKLITLGQLKDALMDVKTDLTSLDGRMDDIEDAQIYTDPNHDGNIVVALRSTATNADNTSY